MGTAGAAWDMRAKRTYVAAACLNCQKSHTSCSPKRPCTKCEEKGILCQDGNRKRTKYLTNKKKTNTQITWNYRKAFQSLKSILFNLHGDRCSELMITQIFTEYQVCDLKCDYDLMNVLFEACLNELTLLLPLVGIPCAVWRCTGEVVYWNLEMDEIFLEKSGILENDQSSISSEEKIRRSETDFVEEEFNLEQEAVQETKQTSTIINEMKKSSEKISHRPQNIYEIMEFELLKDFWNQLGRSDEFKLRGRVVTLDEYIIHFSIKRSANGTILYILGNFLPVF